jgi:hypothetical protein
MKKYWRYGTLAGLWAVSVWGCKTPDPAPSPFESGVYIINAGSSFDNNGSISYLPRNATTASADIFNATNARTLGGVARDYTEIDGKGVILVDNNKVGQDKIEIVEAGTFKSLGTIQAPDVENPRAVVAAGPNKAYVSCWDATGDFSNFYPKPGYVLVIDLASRTVIKKISVTRGADRMVLVGSEVYLGTTGGERVLTVIDIEKDEVRQPGVDVGVNINPVAVDANGRLWAYAASAKEMVRINAATKAVDLRLRVGNSAKSPASIALSQDKQVFYFVNSFVDSNDNLREKGELYSFRITDVTIPATTPIVNRLFSGLGVDPQSGYLYAGVTPSAKQAGYVLRYRPNGNGVALIDSIKAEIAPSKFFFR